jgi:geranylgeranyl diphosphate synthase type I
MEIRGDLTCGVPTVLNIMQAKTAALTGAACQAGAILAGATPEQHQALRQYGERLGMAFQIRDDLLPFTAEDQVTGKTAISDVANLQPTLPVLLAYEAADEAGRDRLAAIFRGGIDPVTAHRDIITVLTGTGALTKAARMASSYAEQARTELTGLPDAPRLAELATSAANRQR